MRDDVIGLPVPRTGTFILKGLDDVPKLGWHDHIVKTQPMRVTAGINPVLRDAARTLAAEKLTDASDWASHVHRFAVAARRRRSRGGPRTHVNARTWST